MAAHARLIYEFDEFQLDPEERTLWRRGQIMPLHGKAFEMLLVLIRNRGRLLTKNELFALVWPDQIVEESNLTVNMSAIRRALGERASNPHYITTISGRGYRFNGEVRQFAGEALTIERETFARLTVQEEEIESRASAAPSVARIAAAFNRVISHPVLLLATTFIVLTIGAVGFWVRGFHRASATPMPWTKMTLKRFATHGGVPFRVAISPDGKSLVYAQTVKGRHTLWLGQIESNSSVQILDQPDGMYHGLTFSPDGQSIYLTEYDSAKLFRLPVVGGVPTFLLPDVDSAVSCSPDGKQFTFLRRGSSGTAIVIADAADGRNERTLISRSRPENFSSAGLSWSPDGQTIAVAAKNAASARIELLAISVSDGSAKKISNRDWGEIGNVKWQPDGSGVLFSARTGPVVRRSEIWFAPYLTGEPRKIVNDLNQYLIQNLSVSANGIVAVMEGVTESEIWIAPDGDISRAHRVLQGVTPRYEGVDGLAWAPDGHLLYVAYVGESQSIWDMNGDGSDRKQLTTNIGEFVDRQISVTADNRYIVFQSNRTGRFQLWRANRDGGGLTQLTSDSTNFQASLSPDGRWIVYVSESSEGPTLWRISIDGGQATRLTNSRASNPQISPDGKWIAYLESSASAPTHLAIIPFGGGEPKKTFALPERPGPNLAKRMCWTPDGRALVYRDTMEGLWRQSLSEQKPQFIKESENVEFKQIAWSNNGKNLAYTEGANLQEIILLQEAH
jgi:Tol biopolymer transport system component/DNA-binding winged helix-turn-helix (wHTH) protein